MIDRTTKALLAAIAVGLFFNAAVPLIQPTTVMAEEAQRGPRGRGAVQPQVQGNVQSQAQQQAQAAAQERERELSNPGFDTDTDKWLRLIRQELMFLGPKAINSDGRFENITVSIVDEIARINRNVIDIENLLRTRLD